MARKPGKIWQLNEMTDREAEGIFDGSGPDRMVPHQAALNRAFERDLTKLYNRMPSAIHMSGGFLVLRYEGIA